MQKHEKRKSGEKTIRRKARDREKGDRLQNPKAQTGRFGKNVEPERQENG